MAAASVRVMDALGLNLPVPLPTTQPISAAAAMLLYAQKLAGTSVKVEVPVSFLLKRVQIAMNSARVMERFGAKVVALVPLMMPSDASVLTATAYHASSATSSNLW